MSFQVHKKHFVEKFKDEQIYEIHSQIRVWKSLSLIHT